MFKGYTTEYLQSRTDATLNKLLAVRCGDVKLGLENAQFFGHAPASNWRVSSNADAMDRILSEIERRREYGYLHNDSRA